MNIVGIESSCDETSVGIICGGELKANLVASQHFHKDYGGVVPELSSRAHLQIINPLLKQAVDESGIELKDIDIISATAGPGLIGAVLVGLTFAKGLSLSLKKKFVGVNHIEGHIFSGLLMEDKPEYPFLCIVVSGGHTLLLKVDSPLKIIRLGSTVDDAAGEAFDKVAKLLGLGYPGGPKIQEYASRGNSQKINFPVARLKNKFDFSFSGIKTAVLRYKQKEYGNNEIPENDICDIAASFQKSVIEALTANVEKALEQFDVKAVALVGGVAANTALRNSIKKLGGKYEKKVVIPDIEFCGDNGAMIANRGGMLYKENELFDLDYNAYPSLKRGGMKYWFDLNNKSLYENVS